MHKTAVVILNWNGIGFLRNFLSNIVQNSVNNDTIVVVADNGSTDGSVEWIKTAFSDVKVLELGSNYGFAGGYNKALELIDATYYVLLNSDIEVSPHWLEPLVNHMDNNPDTAACQPKILSYNNRTLFEHAGAAGCFIDKYGFPFCRGRILHNIEKDSGQYDKVADVFWSSGACMIVRAAAWREAGGFDVAFFAHMEEIDLCWRFSKLGYRIAYIPDASVYHVGGGTLPYTSPRKTYLNFRNSLFMLYKNLPDSKLRWTLFVRKIIDGTAALVFLSRLDFKNFMAVFNAHVDYYKAGKELKDKRVAVRKMEKVSVPSNVLNKCIVFEFYVRGRKTFDLINWN